MPRYGRVVVKLSGEALAGPAGSGVDPASLGQVADEVLSLHDLGVQVAVVVGGGNYFRGRMAEGWGISRAEADNIGMLGTVMNALMLRGVIMARTHSDVRVMTAIPIQSVAEPFIRLRATRHLERGVIVLLAGGIGQPYVTTDYPAVQRALELEADALLVAKRGVDGVYDSDPHVNPDAVRYTDVTYAEALAAGVRVMDTSALVLANEQGLTMHVFDVAATGVMREICSGADLGTRISVKLLPPPAAPLRRRPPDHESRSPLSPRRLDDHEAQAEQVRARRSRRGRGDQRHADVPRPEAPVGRGDPRQQAVLADSQPGQPG
ncbi:MAG: UMP kinase [Streptosporangiaceae bacterium]